MFWTVGLLAVAVWNIVNFAVWREWISLVAGLAMMPFVFHSWSWRRRWYKRADVWENTRLQHVHLMNRIAGMKGEN